MLPSGSLKNATKVVICELRIQVRFGDDEPWRDPRPAAQSWLAMCGNVARRKKRGAAIEGERKLTLSSYVGRLTGISIETSVPRPGLLTMLKCA